MTDDIRLKEIEKLKDEVQKKTEYAMIKLSWWFWSRGIVMMRICTLIKIY